MKLDWRIAERHEGLDAWSTYTDIALDVVLILKCDTVGNRNGSKSGNASHDSICEAHDV